MAIFSWLRLVTTVLPKSNNDYSLFIMSHQLILQHVDRNDAEMNGFIDRSVTRPPLILASV